MSEPLKLRGRTFSHDELVQIRAIVAAAPAAHRFALSKQICEAFDWRQPNGRLKDRSCRDVLQRLHDAGLVSLPPRRRPPVRRRPIPLTPRTEPRQPPAFTPHDIDATHFSIVTRSGRRSDERLWNEYVERHHYLRYGVPVGPNIKYFVHVNGEPIALMAFGGAAWKTAPRDRWIGWTARQREANLSLVVNNTRFLILPWIRVHNLASRLLALAEKRLLDDWHALYAYRPLLLETFVHAERHAGTSYRAANWLCVGSTQGRGKTDRHKTMHLPKKLVFLRPLVHDARAQLARCASRPAP